MTEITLLRLGHRAYRDRRLTTHVCLTARAMGAERVVFPKLDENVQTTVEDVTERFGGSFTLEEHESWRPFITDFDGPSLHLTMYGQRHDDVLANIGQPERLLLIVGSQKVPGDVYDLATHNVAVGNQPHSEVAALATILYEIEGSHALYAQREGADVVIEPSDEGKRVREQ